MSAGNLKVLPQTGHAPSNEAIAAHLRQQAQWIEEGGPIRNVFMVIEREDGSVYRQTMGQPCDLARAVGLVAISLIRDVMERE